MSNTTKSGYLSSAMLMLVSSVAVKIIGAVYKIPLTAFIGAVGRGYFAAAYNLYMPLHALLMGSFPIALSRLVSRALAQGDSKRLMSLRKGSVVVFRISGLAGSIIIAAAAVPYAVFVAGSAKCIYTVLVLAPSLMLSMLAACRRSFYEGRMNMTPTAVSQLLEAVFKLALGLLFAKLSMTLLMKQYLMSGAVLGKAVPSRESALSEIYPLTSAAAMLGVTVGSLLGYLYMLFYDSRHRERVYQKVNLSAGRTELLTFSFPIMLSAAVQSVFQFTDTATVQRALAAVPTEILREAYNSGTYAVNIAEADMVTYTYGLFSTALDFKNLIPGITMVLGVCAVPAICREYEQGDSVKTGALINTVLKYTVLLSVFGSGLLLINAQEILWLFYGESAPDVAQGCVQTVRSFALTLPLYSVASTAVFCVQALGKPSRSVVPYIVSGIVRAVLNYILVQRSLLLLGAVLSGAAGYLLLCIGNMMITYRLANSRLDWRNVLLKPLLAGIGGFLLCGFTALSTVNSQNILFNLLMKSVVFAFGFCILCLFCRAVNYREIISTFHSKKMA